MRKKFAAVVALLLCMQLIVPIPVQAAARFNDIGDVYQAAQTAIEKWADYGIVYGVGNGRFAPTSYFKRYQMAVMLVRIMGYEESAPNTFTDMYENQYLDYVLKCVEAGVFDAGGEFRPDANITRAEAALAFARALGVSYEANDRTKTIFIDDDQILLTAMRGAVNALVARGVLRGMEVGEDEYGNPMYAFKPNDPIKRQDMAVMFSQAIDALVNTEGESAASGLIYDRTVVVNTPDSILSDVVIYGDLIIAEGVGEGEVTLDNVDIRGELIVRAGGEESIRIRRSKIGNVKVDKKSDKRVSLKVSSDTNIEALNMNRGNLGLVGLNGDTPKVGSVTVQSNTNLAVESGVSLGALYIPPAASNANIAVGGTVDKLDVEANYVTVAITGGVGEVSVTGAENAMTISGGVGDVSVTGAENTVTILGTAEKVTVTGDAPVVKIEGEVKAIVLESPSTKVTVNGYVGTVTVAEQAVGTSVTVGEKGTVVMVEAKAEKTEIANSGTVMLTQVFANDIVTSGAGAFSHVEVEETVAVGPVNSEGAAMANTQTVGATDVEELFEKAEEAKQAAASPTPTPTATPTSVPTAAPTAAPTATSTPTPTTDPGPTTPTTVSVTGVSISITAPVAGAKPQETIKEGAEYIGTISWNTDPTAFEVNTVYTATVTLTAKSGYQFTSSTKVTAPDNAVITSSTATSLIFTKAYPATGTNSAPSITTTSYNFDKKTGAQADVTITSSLGSGTLAATAIAGVTGENIAAGNYTITDGVVVIKKEFLATLTIGAKTFVVAFDDSVNTSVNITITITDSSATTHTVTFITSEGTGVEAQTVMSNGVITAPSTTRAGYVFAGWYTDTAFASKFDLTSPITANTTLYAKWQSVTVTGNAGSITASSVESNNALTINVSGSISYEQNIFADTVHSDFVDVLSSNKPNENLGGHNGAFTAVSINLYDILVAKGVATNTEGIIIEQRNEALKVYAEYSSGLKTKSDYTMATLQSEKFNVLLLANHAVTLTVTAGSVSLTINITTTGLSIGGFATEYAQLSGLTISSGTLTPTFDKDVYSYTASTTAANINVGLTPESGASIKSVTNNSAAISSPYNVGLTPGTNTIVITVGQNSKGDGVYTVVVTRQNVEIVPAALTGSASAVPVYGNTANTVLTNGTGYSGVVSWAPNDATFKANQVYTATVTLTAATGYAFPSSLTDAASIIDFKLGNVAPTTWNSRTDTQLVFQTTFTATGTPSATISDITVDGYKNTALAGGKKVTLTLTNAKFSVGASEDATTWFTNCPAGMTATIEAASTGNTAIVVFGGTPSTASGVQMSVKIPMTSIDYTAEITVTDNTNAKYAIVEPTMINDLNTSAKSDTTVNLTWTAAVGAESVVLQQKNKNADDSTYIKASYNGDLTSSSTGVLVTGLTPKTEYTFRLVVTGGANAGESNKLNVETNPAAGSLVSGTFSTTATNTIKLTLTNATFASDLALNQFSFAGTDGDKFNATSCEIYRISNTVVLIRLKSGNWSAVDGNTIIVAPGAISTTQDTPSVTATMGDYYKIGGTIDAGSSGMGIEGLVASIYASDDTTFVSPLGSNVQAPSNASGEYTLSGLYEKDNNYTVRLNLYPNSKTTVNFTNATADVTNADITISLPVLAAPTGVALSDEGVVTWTGVTTLADNTTQVDGVSYDVKLYKGTDTTGTLIHTVENVATGVSVLSAMLDSRGGTATQPYTVTVTAKKDAHTSAVSASESRTVKPVQAIGTLTYNAPNVTWTLATDGGAVPFKYTVRIYHDSAVIKTYYVAHSESTLNISDILNKPETQAAGNYTVTVQPHAERVGGSGVTAGLEGTYKTIAYDGVASTATAIFTVSGDVTVTINKSGTGLPTVWHVEPTFTPSSPHTAAKGTDITITANSGVTVTGTSDLFANSYVGYKVSGWTVSDGVTGTKITTDGLHDKGTEAKLSISAIQTGDLTVTATYQAVNAVPYIMGSADMGHIVDLSAGVDIVQATDFSDSCVIYFVTSLEQFSFKDNSRGGASLSGIDSFTYKKNASGSNAGAMWEITANVSSYTGFVGAMHSGGNTMAKYTDIVKINADLTNNGEFKFSDNNLARANAPLIIDGSKDGGGKYKLDFGINFGVVSNLTIRNLEVNVTSNYATMNTETAAVLFDGGTNITLDNMTITSTGARSTVYIGANAPGNIEITNCIITRTLDLIESWRSGIYLGANMYSKVTLTNNIITARTPLEMASETLTASMGKYTGNTFESNEAPHYDVRVKLSGLTFLKASFTNAESITNWTDYFTEGEALKTFLEAMRGSKNSFSAIVALDNDNAVLSYTGSAWQISHYKNSGTLAAIVPQRATYYAGDGYLVIEMNANMNMANVTKIGLGDNQIQLCNGATPIIGLGFSTANGGNYYSNADSVAACSDVGKWYWSEKTLIINVGKIGVGLTASGTGGVNTNNDATVFNDAIGSNWADAKINFHAWYTATGYNSGTTATVDLHNDPGNYITTP